MPQYVVGHLARVAAIKQRLDLYPGLALAGSAYRGVGIADCIRSGEAAAERLLGIRAEPRESSPGIETNARESRQRA
jgi:oxygen-dependent protoporphyrinogen oxidase